MSAFEITGLAKSGGVLSKHISLMADGSVKRDGSACCMGRGAARRLHFDTLQQFAECISSLEPHEAIALGALRPDLPDEVRITTKSKLNGSAYLPNDLIARTADCITYRPGNPALALLDIDTKDIPGYVRTRIEELGGYGAALKTIIPELAGAGRIVRRSTSAGLYRLDANEEVVGSDGRHVYVPVIDGTDVERFLRRLHDRLWLHRLGWFVVSRSGQLLERSLIDRMVYAPERLVFEGAPILEPPLTQDPDSRLPYVTEGPPLDTRATCPDLTLVEQAKLRVMKDAERHHLSGEVDKARARAAEDYANRTGCTLDAARQAITRRLDGILLPNVVLPFDDDELAGKTVADVLANPDQFVGETLADPLEGVGYGRGKAKVLQRADGSLWVHSFAHGRTIYDLKYDAATIGAALNACDAAEVVNTFIRLLLLADVAPDEEQRLRQLVCELSGVKARPLDAIIKAAREKQKGERAEAERRHRAAIRIDPRPQLPAPPPDAPWLPEMKVLDEVLGASHEAEPPMRDVDGVLTIVRARRVHSLHQLTAAGANQEEAEQSRLPPPEEPLLTRLSEMQAAELIERYIDYIDDYGRSVHLAAPFVRHYRQRDDSALPIVTAVATLPLVLPNGNVLSGRGLNREFGIVFRVPEQLEALLPRTEDCTSAAMVEAIRFLTDEWLADVATDYAGKCMLIALALTIIERAVLPQRPAFFVAAGQRSIGKTTVIHMISTAVLGRHAAASAWSSSEEERRKALLSYLGEGVALLVWDNIARGAAISCPSIEKALTAESYRDRVLGVSETRTVPASTVMAFTGNNITARGDMASRSLQVRLTANRPDPENRSYEHPQPLVWTEANRGRILSALYTLLLGNKRIGDADPPPPETRFKECWHLVLAPIEQAAKLHVEYVRALAVDQNPNCPPREISFRTLLLGAEADEEQTSSLAVVIETIYTKWRSGCKASDVAAFVNWGDVAAFEFKAALETASEKAIKVVTATTITWRLKALIDAPVKIANSIFVLHFWPHHGVAPSWLVKSNNTPSGNLGKVGNLTAHEVPGDDRFFVVSSPKLRKCKHRQRTVGWEVSHFSQVSRTEPLVTSYDACGGVSPHS
jgi:hypothetical protein